MGQPKMLSVGKESQKITRVFAAGHDQDIPEHRIPSVCDRVIEHRFVVDRQQMLVRNFGQGERKGNSRLPVPRRGLRLSYKLSKYTALYPGGHLTAREVPDVR